VTVATATTRRTSDRGTATDARDTPDAPDGAGRTAAVLVGIALVVVTCSATWVRTSAARAATGAAAPTATTPDARSTYLSDCATCHGSDGHGTTRGPTLAGVGRAAIDYELSTGRMPLGAVGRSADAPGRPVEVLPNRDVADPEQVPERHDPAYPPDTIAALVDYTASLAGGGGPDIPSVGAGNLPEGGELFRLQCAACHAWAGDGGALLHREAPALHASTDVQIAEAVRVGPGQMPAFGTAALTDDQLNAVVAYVQYLRNPRDRGGDPLWHLGPVTEGAVALVALAALLCFVRWIGERG
jgi:ubiquinol-cytochrome c reductase cytochrome c subunit